MWPKLSAMCTGVRYAHGAVILLERGGRRAARPIHLRPAAAWGWGVGLAGLTAALWTRETEGRMGVTRVGRHELEVEKWAYAAWPSRAASWHSLPPWRLAAEVSEPMLRRAR